MTRDEAIEIRTRQLTGQPVDAGKLLQAIEVLNQVERPNKRVSKTRALILNALMTGPIEKGSLYKAVAQDSRARSVLKRLRDSGLIRYDIRLTDAGLKELGLEGPK